MYRPAGSQEVRTLYEKTLASEESFEAGEAAFPVKRGEIFYFVLNNNFNNANDGTEFKTAVRFTKTGQGNGELSVGEVLLCSGQSNIAISVQYIFNKSDAAIDEYKTYDNFGLIRLYTPVWGGKAEETTYTSPYSVWRNPKRIQDVLNCSAYAVGLALNVQAKLGNGIPVGVVETSTGGSCIEEWLSEDNMKNLPSHSSHSSYYNGMVAFLKGLTLNGVFWYQGEACIEFTEQYEKQLAALIAQYRTDFEDETLPAYLMQLPQLNVAVAYGSAAFETSW